MYSKSRIRFWTLKVLFVWLVCSVYWLFCNIWQTKIITFILFDVSGAHRNAVWLLERFFLVAQPLTVIEFGVWKISASVSTHSRDWLFGRNLIEWWLRRGQDRKRICQVLQSIASQDSHCQCDDDYYKWECCSLVLALFTLPLVILVVLVVGCLSRYGRLSYRGESMRV